MQNFELATRQKLRFSSPLRGGLISTEDLWDLSLEELDQMAQALDHDLKESSSVSFIGKKTTASKGLQLRFDVVKAIIDVKLEEAEKAKSRADIRAKNARIRELMAQKQDSQLQEKSLEELSALLEVEPEV